MTMTIGQKEDFLDFINKHNINTFGEFHDALKKEDKKTKGNYFEYFVFEYLILDS